MRQPTHTRQTPDPQHGPAQALAELVQLPRRYPQLRPVTWTLYPSGALRGQLAAESMADLRAWAAVLGGDIVDDCDPFAGSVEQHRLVAVWRDVRLELAAVLPAAIQPVRVTTGDGTVHQLRTATTSGYGRYEAVAV
ncbi:hypothetical protein [Streptomyces sp. WMMC897]|uniref:hypothetical protein n=1 Tax=Streptomyces sp. WMMC897 TaxID=3014782 RepID=UPI0022B73F2F|nr:hypothetical protein [Streptomyces sp. WMMC897]MCZ7414274.1 hypothetical protein [Streptomyces sp. WMMC897]